MPATASEGEGLRGDLVGQRGGSREHAGPAPHLGVAEHDPAPALRDPSFGDQVVVDDGREEAQLEVDREQLGTTTVSMIEAITPPCTTPAG